MWNGKQSDSYSIFIPLGLSFFFLPSLPPPSCFSLPLSIFFPSLFLFLSTSFSNDSICISAPFYQEETICLPTASLSESGILLHCYAFVIFIGSKFMTMLVNFCSLFNLDHPVFQCARFSERASDWFNFTYTKWLMNQMSMAARTILCLGLPLQQDLWMGPHFLKTGGTYWHI